MFHRSHGIAAAHDHKSLGIGKILRQMFGACAKRIGFKRAHGAVPHNGGGLGKHLLVLLHRVTPDVQNHLIGGHIAHGAGFSLLARSQFLRGDNIHGQGQFLVQVLGLLHNAFGVGNKFFLIQGLAHHIARSSQKRVGDAAAHNEHIHFFQQIFQQGQLGGHLGAADDRRQRPGGLVQHLAEGLQLRLQQRSGARHPRNANRAFRGGVGTVGGAKGVHHIHIAKACQLLGQGGVVLLLALEKPHVLQQRHFTRRSLGLFQGCGHNHWFAQQFGKTRGHGLERELLFILAFGGTAKVRKQHHARALFQRGVYGGQGSAYALVVGYLPVLHGNVEIFADHNGFARQIQILHFLDGHMRSPCFGLIIFSCATIIFSGLQARRPPVPAHAPR